MRNFAVRFFNYISYSRNYDEINLRFFKALEWLNHRGRPSDEPNPCMFDSTAIILTSDDDEYRNFGPDDQVIDGKAGSDAIYTGSGMDYLYGNDGDDIINSGDGNDTLFGGKGADRLYAEEGDDKIYGNDGDDFLYGKEGNDLLVGGEGNDTLIGQHGDDTLRGGEGDDILNAGTGTNILHGNKGDDRLVSGGGDDKLYGGKGNDLLYAGGGNDLLRAGSGDDKLFGQNGNDTLQGGRGYDQLNGGKGDDILISNASHATDLTEVSGDDGFDKLYGSDDGIDVFIVTKTDFADEFYNFNEANDDVINIADVLDYDSVTDSIYDYVALTQSGDDTIIAVDGDGTANGSTFIDVAVVKDVVGLDIDSLISNDQLIVS